MAIVDLGTRIIAVGGGDVSFTPFPYEQDRSYGVTFTITAAQPNLVFSELIVDLFLDLDTGGTIIYPTQYVLDILRSPRILFFPMSPLIGADGDITITIKRQNIIRGGGDGGDVTINCVYDDANDQRTWLPEPRGAPN